MLNRVRFGHCGLTQPKKNEELDAYIQDILNKGYIKGMGERHTNLIYEFRRDHEKNGFYVIPKTGWMTINIYSCIEHTFQDFYFCLNPPWIKPYYAKTEVFKEFTTYSKQEIIQSVIAATENNGHGRDHNVNTFPVKAGDILFYNATGTHWKWNPLYDDNRCGITLYYDI